MPRMSFVALTLLLIAVQVQADRIAPIAQPNERALRVPVVVIGKVTVIEKETVDAPLYPGATNKVAHKIAVVKVETNFAGAENTTHLKIGFVPAGMGGRRGPENPELKVDEVWLFFLVKHHNGEFFAIPYMTPPVPSTAENYKSDVDAVKKILAIVADPAKALKAEKAEERYQAAIAIICKYRVPHEQIESIPKEVALTADESRPILKALAEQSWKAADGYDSLGGYRAFTLLGLTDKDGWKAPAAEAGKDYFELTREAYIKWLDGPGKDYRIKKMVPKK